MTWFSLPPARTGTPPPFCDKAGCDAWLAAQPLANAPQMQGVFAVLLDSLNGWKIPARERFKILESMRKSVVAVEAESLKRYEYRPLPLSPVEQKALDASCRLWRELTVGYLHCLRACLDGDAGVSEHAAKICHRVVVALRQEQLCRYYGGSAVPGQWWRKLHAALASAEQLGVASEPVSDRLFAETRESTIAGQYAMAILLHLCRPCELSRSQFSAIVRWLARWREQATIHASPDEVRNARCVVVDLSANAPLHLGETAPAMPRWIVIDAVLSKLKGRAKALREGQTPEELKLGSGLPAEACIALLQFLHGSLQAPPPAPPAARDGARSISLGGSVESAYRLLGGAPLVDEAAPTSLSNRRLHDQIAIFGHVVKDDSTTAAVVATDSWQVLTETTSELVLRRMPGSTDIRLNCRSLVAAQDGSRVTLAVVRSLVAQEDGSLLATLRLLPGVGVPMLAFGQEKGTNRQVQYPAVFLPATAHTGAPPSLFLPGGTMNRLSRLDVVDLPDRLRAGQPIERGANFDRLRCD
ncbi:MAG: hypothetical protein HYU78_12365 [Rhodocyclales bacterium]|nr:hypothetical protein [Rhodocyclales bacterium]